MSEQPTESTAQKAAEAEFLREEHPASQPVQAGDPMAMTAGSAPGDPELMLTILVEEFAAIGMDVDEVMGLFRDPFYSATAGLLKLLGEERICVRVNQILEHCGSAQVSVCAAPVCT